MLAGIFTSFSPSPLPYRPVRVTVPPELAAANAASMVSYVPSSKEKAPVSASPESWLSAAPLSRPVWLSTICPDTGALPAAAALAGSMDASRLRVSSPVTSSRFMLCLFLLVEFEREGSPKRRCSLSAPR